ncbi:hypothetical protein SFC43_05275 [Bacteroides sp. CR5/BHMF/2]|nr:hypothetical protein [Bacteroides sp. CR5/BHMF/2]
MKFFNTGKEYDADEVGVLKMDMVPRNELRTGMWIYYFRYQDF